MPESSSSNNTIDLYKCIDFPYKWKKKTLIDNILLLIPIWLKKDGLWYLLTSEKSKGISFGDELSLYITDDLLNGKFIPAAGKLISHDISKSRNGGFITNDLRIFRTVQKRYGYKINFMEITWIIRKKLQWALY